MATTVVRANFPYQFFVDSSGGPLDAGYVYLGQVGKDPRTNPVTAYWDAAGTIPAAQPLRTSNGFITRAGTPANIFVGGTYSMLVQDKRGAQVYSVPDSAAGAESTVTDVTPADGVLSWEPAAVAALTAASAAANRSTNENPDSTLPPAPTGLSAAPGTLTASITWTKAAYTVGHGPGRVIVYAAEWTAETAPLVTEARALGGIAEPVARETLSINPQKKVRVWLAFESADGFEGPKSAPVDATSSLIGRADIGDLIVTQADISDGLEMGRLVNDPSFAGGAQVWTGFVSRHASTDAAAPPNTPAPYMAFFKGRDCLSNRRLSVDSGDSYLLSIWFNPLNTGLTGGFAVYEYYADARPVTAQAFVASPVPAANTWTRVKAKVKVSPGAVAWLVGPNINQPHNGQAVCAFANLRMGLMVESDLIVQGAVVADTIAARSINTEQLVIGAATDTHATATIERAFVVETGAGSTNSVYQSATPYVEVPFSKKLGRGTLIIRARYECSLTSSGASLLRHFELVPMWALLHPTTRTGIVSGGVEVSKHEDEPPVMWKYRTPVDHTAAVANISRTYSMILNIEAQTDAILIFGLDFRGVINENAQGNWVPTSSETLLCMVSVSAEFVENKV